MIIQIFIFELVSIPLLKKMPLQNDTAENIVTKTVSYVTQVTGECFLAVTV